MDSNMAELYMKFLCEHLKEIAPQWKGKGVIRYKANVTRAKKKEDAKTLMLIAGDCPRSLSFRMADIIRFRREKIWNAPAFMVTHKGDEIYLEDNIVVCSDIGLGTLARETAIAISIFVEKYLKKE